MEEAVIGKKFAYDRRDKLQNLAKKTSPGTQFDRISFPQPAQKKIPALLETALYCHFSLHVIARKSKEKQGKAHFVSGLFLVKNSVVKRPFQL
jgi:hypothetical protein